MEHAQDSGREPRRRNKRKAVRVGRTRVGKGVFAHQNYPASGMVGEITGQVIDDPDYGSDYCFDIGDGLHLEPVAPFRFINHCCEPNCEFDYLEFEDEPTEERRKHVFLFALRDIRQGEELTIDYNWSTTDAIRCRCQAPTCRGWVVREDLAPEMDARLAESRDESTTRA